MPVNHAGPAPTSADAESRLYLREDELDRAVALVFSATRRFWRTAEGSLEALGLGAAHYRALAAIRRGEPLPVSDLIDRLEVRKQSLARVLDELERAGLIARSPGVLDRRQRLVRLTDAGHAAERETTTALRDRLAQVFRAAGGEAVSGARLVLGALAAEDGE